MILETTITTSSCCLLNNKNISNSNSNNQPSSGKIVNEIDVAATSKTKSVGVDGPPYPPSLPVEILASRIGPFLDRQSLNQLSLVRKDIRAMILSSVVPPWPDNISIHLTLEKNEEEQEQEEAVREVVFAPNPHHGEVLAILTTGRRDLDEEEVEDWDDGDPPSYQESTFHIHLWSQRYGYLNSIQGNLPDHIYRFSFNGTCLAMSTRTSHSKRREQDQIWVWSSPFEEYSKLIPCKLNQWGRRDVNRTIHSMVVLDHQSLIFACDKGEIRLWNFSSGTKEATVQFVIPSYSLCFGPTLVFSKHTQILAYKRSFEELAFWNWNHNHNHNHNHSAFNLDHQTTNTQRASSNISPQPPSIGILRFDISQNGDMLAALLLNKEAIGIYSYKQQQPKQKQQRSCDDFDCDTSSGSDRRPRPILTRYLRLPSRWTKLEDIKFSTPDGSKLVLMFSNQSHHRMVWVYDTHKGSLLTSKVVEGAAGCSGQ